MTLVGVVSPGMFPMLGIGLRDCVGGSLGRSDWLDWLSVGVVSGSSNGRAQCWGHLPRGSQDRVYKECAARELFT